MQFALFNFNLFCTIHFFDSFDLFHLISLVFYLFLFTEKSFTDLTSHFSSNGIAVFTDIKPFNSIYSFSNVEM